VINKKYAKLVLLIPGKGRGLRSFNGFKLLSICALTPGLRVSGKDFQIVMKLIKLKIAANVAGVENGFTP